MDETYDDIQTTQVACMLMVLLPSNTKVSVLKAKWLTTASLAFLFFNHSTLDADSMQHTHARRASGKPDNGVW